MMISESKIQNLKSKILLVLILVLAVFLRFYLLDGQSFWNDEGNSARIAERSLQLITEGAAGDIHPPLYYYLLHFWRSVFLPRESVQIPDPFGLDRYLGILRGAFGSDESVFRSFSALLGVLLVGLTFLIGRKVFGVGVGLLAAFVAAINPFQIYYSQEARMYMLLAVIGAAATFFLLRLLEGWSSRDRGSGNRGSGNRGSGNQGSGNQGSGNQGSVNRGADQRRLSSIIDHASLIILYAVGFYTHYAFPFILVTHFLIIVIWTLVTRARWHSLIVWIGLVAAAGVLFLPWLPTAARQITTWPAAPATMEAGQMLLDTLRLYVAGPTLPTGEATLAILACSFFILAGLWNPHGFDERRAEAHDVLPYSIRMGSIVLWWLVPITLIFDFGLFKDAYLKFFIVGSAAFCLLLARGISNMWDIGRGAAALPRELAGQRWAGWGWTIVVLALCAVVAVPMFTALRNYYFDPAYARDDYRGIAQRILKTRRADDAVLLDSANQWEVFTYYYPDGPNVYPLPRSRPVDKAAVETELAQIAAQHPRLFVLYWGDGEADPQRMIETWLDAHTYKATEQWVNSIRFATYAAPTRLSDAPAVQSGARFGEHITLAGYTLPSTLLQPGDILPLDLFWRTDAPSSERYKVFVHVLDQNGQIIAQTDREPGGGQSPTTDWKPAETIVDRYGVLLPEDTPPGTYAIEIGMYDFNGKRLPVGPSGDALMVGEITVQ